MIWLAITDSAGGGSGVVHRGRADAEKAIWFVAGAQKSRSLPKTVVYLAVHFAHPWRWSRKTYNSVFGHKLLSGGSDFILHRSPHRLVRYSQI